MPINGQSRRQQIARSAATAFRRRSYRQVSLKDLAAEAGISAPAIYKHFSGKAEILQTAITLGLDEVLAAIEEADAAGASFDEFLVRLAGVAIEQRDLWTLIHRDLHNLDENARRQAGRRFRAVNAGVRDRLAAEYPETGADELNVRVRAVVACMAAPAEYPQRSSDHTLARNIASTATELSRIPLRTDPVALGATPLLPAFGPQISRREELLAAAAGLFADRGYEAVGLTDIGRAVGISGPSIYSHFESKLEILETLMRRAVGWIEYDRALILTEASDTHTAATLWLHRYVAMATTNHALFSIYTDEIGSLSDTERRWITRSHEDYIHSWVKVIKQVTGLKEAAAYTLTTCALSVINDLSGAAEFRKHKGADRVLTNLVVDLVVPRSA